MENKKDLFLGSLLAGAIGDALGYTVEFMKLSKIKVRFGDKGITDLEVNKLSGKALISDDTQMTLFTADGIVCAYRNCSEDGKAHCTTRGVYKSYLRWYYTQSNNYKENKGKFFINKQEYENDFSILDYKELYVRRAPGLTCLSALGSGVMGTMEESINKSKGCGGVMRVAPVGLFFHKNPNEAFKVACEVAAITHGHPTGYLSSGVLATIIAELINGKSILDSIESSIDILKEYKGYEETLNIVEKAIELSKSKENSYEAISKLGEGWIAEEALAIAIYCALKEEDFKEALIMAVNHDGDSDSTGAILGNILGAAYGTKVIPQNWVENIELKDLIFKMSNRLFELMK